MYDFIVIGGGIAGLAASALLTKESHNTLLLEQHYLLGGCAGYYLQPGGIVFDAGATTLSGFQNNQPLARLLNDLNIKLDLKRENISQIIYLEKKKIHRYRNLNEFIAELEKKYPHIEHRAFWLKLNSIAETGWKLAEKTKYFPPKSFQDVSLLAKELIKNYHHIFDLPKLFKHAIPRSYKSNPELMKFLDEQLLISTQTTSQDVGLVVAALGLTYPQDIAYPLGGMKQVIDKIENQIPKKSIMKRTRVQEIHQRKDHWEIVISTSKENERIVLKSKKIISTIPHWNLREMTSGKVQKYFDDISVNFDPIWSAEAAHLALDLPNNLDSRYHQVHDELGSLFFSFSDGEKQRSKECYLTATVSTHYKLPLKDDLESLKEHFKLRVIKALKIIFRDLKNDNIAHYQGATPKTFEFFTGRKFGSVGGIPHIGSLSAIKMPKSQTSFSGFYRTGDTVFPGQGIVGVIQGVYNCLERIN